MTQTFIVEANTSSRVIGAVLSQRHGPEKIQHPITYYVWKLIPAESNYEILDKELRAIKTAFEEWQHYLKRAHHLVQVFTIHKNLEYLCRAKVLNQ